MKRLFLVFIFALLSIYADAQWQQLQTPVLEQADVRTAVATDSGFYIGTPSGVYRSLDDGFTWQHSFKMNGKEAYFKIKRLLGCGNGLVAFSDSLIYVSVNAGKTWSNLNLPFKDNYSLQAINNRLLCLGYNAKNIRELYFSDDMGSHWDRSVASLYLKSPYSYPLFPNTAQDLIFLEYNDSSGSKVKSKLAASKDGEHFFDILNIPIGISGFNLLDIQLGISGIDGDSGHTYTFFSNKPCLFNTGTGNWDTLSVPNINWKGLKDTSVTIQNQFFYHGSLFIEYVKCKRLFDSSIWTFNYLYFPMLFKSRDNGLHWQKLSTVFFGDKYVLHAAFKNPAKFIIYNGPLYSNDAGSEDETRSNFRIMLDSGKTATYSNRRLYAPSARIYQIDTQLLVLRSTFINLYKMESDFTLSRIPTGIDTTDLYNQYPLSYNQYPLLYASGKKNAMVLDRNYNANDIIRISSDWGNTWKNFPHQYQSAIDGPISFFTVGSEVYTLSRTKYSSDFGINWIYFSSKLPVFSNLTYIDQIDSDVNVLCETTIGNHILYHTNDLINFKQKGRVLKLSGVNLSHIASVPVVTGIDSVDATTIYYLKDSTWTKAKMLGISQYDRNHVFRISIKCLGEIVYFFYPGSTYYSTDLGEHFQKMDDLPDGLYDQSFAMHDSILFMSSNAGIWYNKSFLKEHHLSSLTKEGQTAPAGAAIKVFPNPAHNLINIQLSLQKPEQVQLQLMSMDGRIVYSKNSITNTGNTTIPLSVNSLQPGIYLLKLTTEGNQYTEKIAVN